MTVLDGTEEIVATLAQQWFEEGKTISITELLVMIKSEPSAKSELSNAG